MKKILLATAALLALGSASASAADMAARTYTKAPVYAAPIYNWTGLYVGAHIGGAFGGDSGIGVAGFNSNNDAAFLGGGQIGADYQFAPNWVLGVEGQFSGLSNNNRSFNSAAFALSTKNDWLASVTGRLGYTWGPGLIYAKGGVAFRDNNGTSLVTVPGGVATAFTTNRDDTGYTVGGGLEYMFAPAWSAKVEYQYYNFGTTNVTTVAAPFPAGASANYRDDLHTVKAGINYHFNWGGPVVAKY